MQTTIKVTKETKNRILQLDIAEKDKTFDAIINELLTYYQKSEKKYKKERKEWTAQWKIYKNDWEQYEKKKKAFEKEEASWKRLMKWAKTKGFKG